MSGIDFYNEQSLSGNGLQDLTLSSLTVNQINNVSSTTLSYLDATSSIQTQINNIVSVNGTTPVFSITPTISLPSGSPVVTIDNTNIATPKLTFSLVRGAAGVDGIGIDGINGIDGIDGTNGSNGLNGAQGVRGFSGVPGFNGSDGITPNISIGTVTKLNPGSNPTVVVDVLGTNANPIFNFGLVTGNSGTNGSNGSKGSDGDKGDKGDTGEKGDTGDQGIAADVLSVANLLLSTSAIVVGGIAYTGLSSALGAMKLAIDELIFKTQFMSVNIFYAKTTFSSDLSVTNGVADQFKVTASNGNVSCGEVNSTYLASTGNISGQKMTSNNLVCPYYDYQSTTTASTINIGSNGLGFIVNHVNIGQKGDIIFINGVQYEAPPDTTTSPTIKFVQQGFF